MAHGKVVSVLPASSVVVFDLLHDYTRRLEWDTLLRAAYLEGGATAADNGVIAVCAGRWSLGGIALRTVYVSFQRPSVAAVKMVNTPPFFRSWAASIRHADLADGQSRITYTFHFTAKPQRLAFILEPVMERVFAWETRKRLRALAAYLSGSGKDQRDRRTFISR